MTETALITGASGGIGLDFARKFAENGYDLVLVARSQDKLNTLAEELRGKHGVDVQVMPKDLTDPAAPEAIYEALKADGKRIDVLINNAGYATYGLFHELDTTREMNMIQLNIMALTHLTRLFLPDMVARRSGRILNVASTAAFQPGPLMAVYYASKAFVLHFSEAIANELQGTGVSVTALCPGPTESGFQQRAAMEDSKLVQNGLMSSREVVDIGYDGLMAGKPVVIPGMQNQLLSLAPRLLPRKTVAGLVRNTQERVSH
jgi:hypothetical protein